jgi:hypothetical protein
MKMISQILLFPAGTISASSVLSEGCPVATSKKGAQAFVGAIKRENGSFRPLREKDLMRPTPCMVSIYRAPRMKPVNRRRDFVPHRNVRKGIQFVRPKKPSPYLKSEGAFQSMLRNLVDEEYHGDARFAASSTGVIQERMHEYMRGSLPRNLKAVCELAAQLEIDDVGLMMAWIDDVIAAIDYLYPMTPAHSPLSRQLIRIVRLATTLIGGLGPVQTMLRELGFESLDTYHMWNEVYTAIVDNAVGYRRSTFLKEAPRIIEMSGVLSAAEVTLIVEEIRSEQDRALQRDMEIPVGSAEEVYEQAAYWPIFYDQETTDPHELYVTSLLERTFDRVLGTLPSLMSNVLRLRFGLNTFRAELRLEEVGTEIDATRERVRQIEAKGLRYLKSQSRLRKLEPFFENA